MTGRPGCGSLHGKLTEPVFPWRHTGVFFELPQESVDVIDPHQRADIADAQLGVRQKLHRFLNPEELDAGRSGSLRSCFYNR